MKRISFPIIFAGIAVAILFYVMAATVQSRDSADAALAGQVSSQEEGQMEGVLVGAKREGSTITVYVVSDEKGHYSFPQDRLQPGRYFLRIRAVGYDLESPGPVEIAAGKTTELNLKLHKTKNLAAQLSNSEWLMSMPGTKEQKMALYGCVMCHTLERIVRSSHDVDEWMQTLARMNYYVGSTPLKPQRRPPPTPEELALPGASNRRQRGGEGMEGEGGGMEGRGGGPQQRRAMAEFLASVNLSKGTTWDYELKTLPRPKAQATHVIITTYDLPRKETMVHDSTHGPDGMVWYTDFGSQFFGKLDPKTGQVVEFPVPVLKPRYPQGLMDIRFDKQGNLWMGMMAQGGIAKFDTKAQKLQTYNLPPAVNGNDSQVAMVMPYSSDVDGKVWMNNVGPTAIQRLDVKTGEMETIFPYANYKPDGHRHGGYGINADALNNLYVDDIGSNLIVRIDAKTLEVKFFPTPTPDSGPRRARMDSQYRLWIAESRADKFARFDPKTERFQEWPSPTPFSQIYDVMPDTFGSVWAGGMTSDMIYRLDPKTGQTTAYLLPVINTNVRRVDVDDSKGHPEFWTGDDHSPIIMKLEPLD